eukprot:gb/GFBE01064034.1/.p1 GENE.gb/GFBE01064034.1/~~gb/GFBE01064034.1/.p1  ORF type:complete len:671 (+),score=115.87 gb/GFBE01064034.1/:1-2013(+)
MAESRRPYLLPIAGLLFIACCCWPSHPGESAFTAYSARHLARSLHRVALGSTSLLTAAAATIPGRVAADSGNFKGAVLEWVQATMGRPLSPGDIEFDLEGKPGSFKATLRITGVDQERPRVFQGSVCSKKKEAERSAAEAAWLSFVAGLESTEAVTEETAAELPVGAENSAAHSPGEEAEAANGVVQSGMRFSDLKLSEPTSRSMSERFGYQFMTDVQEQTIVPLLEGADVLGRAKTGSGKTLAFLIPIVEQLYRSGSNADGGIRALVISPTRELALQIAKDARKLVAFHRELGVQVTFGGTNKQRDQRQLSSEPCDLLVATPGRLVDHISTTPGFADRLRSVQSLVLDEADQLLDMGFRKSILAILDAVPAAASRQSMLFSATFPKQVTEVAGLALKPDYVHINAVKSDDEETPTQIAQFQAVVNMEDMARALWGAIHRSMQQNPESFKIIVFFTTAKVTQYFAEVFRRAGLDIFELHSKKSQSYRMRVSDQFRSSKRSILFSSDVSARGVDYPDVTEVVQVGAPSSREQYVHRIGRTGRAGKSGSSTLLLHDFERYFLDAVNELQLEEVSSQELLGTGPAESTLTAPVDKQLAQQAYKAWLGHYKDQRKLVGWSLADVVSQGSRFARSISAIGPDGLPPPITKKTRGLMGLKGVTTGLNVVAELPWKT